MNPPLNYLIKNLNIIFLFLNALSKLQDEKKLKPRKRRFRNSTKTFLQA